MLRSFGSQSCNLKGKFLELSSTRLLQILSMMKCPVKTLPSCKVVPDLSRFKEASVALLVLGDSGELGRLLIRSLSKTIAFSSISLACIRTICCSKLN